MKRSIGARLGAIVVALAVLSATASACTPPPKPKLTWQFYKLSLGSPGAGIRAGENAPVIYAASGLPGGAVIRLQKAAGSGKGTTWTTVLNLRVSPLGLTQIVKAPFGRNAYRLAAFDAKGRLLVSAGHTLDVYRTLTFSQITTRPVQTVKLPGGDNFNYTYQAVIHLEHISCRAASGLDVYNRGPFLRQIQFTQTIGAASKTVTKTVSVTKGNDYVTLFQPELQLTPGEDFDLQVLSNDFLGSNVFGDGNAECFTSTGEF